MAEGKPGWIQVRYEPGNPLSLRATDKDGNTLHGIRSITWSARANATPRCVIEADIDIDVAGLPAPCEAQVTLDEIRNWLTKQIAPEANVERVSAGHPAEMQSNGALIVLRAMHAQFFAD